MGKVNIYCASTIKSGMKTDGLIMYLLDAKLQDGTPYTKHWIDEIEATRNASGLECVIRAVKHINLPAEVHIFTDSNYVKNGIEKMARWKAEGWANPKTGEERPNKGTWEELCHLLKGSSCTVEVGIHDKMNEMQSKMKEIQMKTA